MIKTDKKRHQNTGLASRQSARPPSRTAAWLCHTLAALLLLGSTALLAHPFDQVRADSNSSFIIKRNTVSFKLKFPVHAYVNLWVTSPAEYDKYIRRIETRKEKKRIRQYVNSHVKVFDGKTRVALKIKKLSYERATHSGTVLCTVRTGPSAPLLSARQRNP